jgi:methylphosphotriester-DNA--protein-cysteine methyltransferase
MNALYYSEPECSLEQLAGKTGFSLRQLERKVSGSAGVGPKYFMRLTRFYRAMRSLHLNRNLGAVDIALEQGYHDQAHFIHDCKDISGHTPGGLLALSGGMSHFYNTSLGCRSMLDAKFTKHEVNHRILHGPERVGTET